MRWLQKMRLTKLGEERLGSFKVGRIKIGYFVGHTKKYDRIKILVKDSSVIYTYFPDFWEKDF